MQNLKIVFILDKIVLKHYYVHIVSASTINPIMITKPISIAIENKSYQG